MNRFWINNEKKDDKIIAVINNKILKANPKNQDLNQFIRDVENGIIPKTAYCIPFTHIKSLQYQEKEKYLQVFYGQDSESHLYIHDDAKRDEIFEYFKNNIPSTEYRIEKHNETKAAKKPLIALAIIIILYIWTISLAIGVEAGHEYEVIGNKRSIASVVLAIAQFGTIKITLAFLFLIGLTIRKFIRNIHNNTNIYIIEIIR
jgi:hypothetical protein